jgi:hypothetical protein
VLVESEEEISQYDNNIRKFPNWREGWGTEESILWSFDEAIRKSSEEPLYIVTEDFKVQVGKVHGFAANVMKNDPHGG